MAYLNKIVEIYKEEENDFIHEDSLETVKTAALYMFYHYYNADVTKLDEMNNQFCFLNGDIADIISINYNFYEENSIDFITVLPATIMMNLTKIDFSKIYPDFLKKVNEVVANVICRNINSKNEKVLSKFDEFDVDNKTTYNIVVLCNYPVDIEKKLWYQSLANEYKVKNDLIRIQILFEDDILEEVSDVESPKDSVAVGEFKLFDNCSVCYFGNEHSFLGFISAKSLQKNYYLYSTHGLFASNLRYYVKSAKIDSQIIQTIMKEPDNFCYYNNGIIVTCDDYKIDGDLLTLYNFSIVNGGQTTNLIGRNSFDNDFSVMCKVIKNKYSELCDKVDFLSKVAEASNTQKPIKAKDLIANRKEQRLLKIQFEQAGMFLQIKRGEKIPKDIYSQPWQNAANDQVAQMLYSSVYQMPGAAKNSKSKLLENEKIYNKLFKSNYNSKFFISLQHIKVGFNNWVKKLKKEEKYGSTKLGLAKNGDLITIAIISLIYKLMSSETLFDKISSVSLSEINSNNEELKFLIGQNDIGTLNFLNSNLVINIGKKTLFDLFEYVYAEILIPSYDKFKKNYSTYSYGNYVKSDLYYYNFAIPFVIKSLKNNQKFSYNDIFDLSVTSNVIINMEDSFDEYKPGLEDELIEFRTRTYKMLNIKPYEVFKNNQLAYMLKYKPKTVDELHRDVKFSEYQCVQFGEAICKIIRKYTSIKEFMEEE